MTVFEAWRNAELNMATGPVCVKELRHAIGLTQEEFCVRFRIPLGTLRDWEQGRAEPDQTARAYLKAIAGDAQAVKHALEVTPPQPR